MQLWSYTKKKNIYKSNATHCTLKQTVSCISIPLNKHYAYKCICICIFMYYCNLEFNTTVVVVVVCHVRCHVVYLVFNYLHCYWHWWHAMMRFEWDVTDVRYRVVDKDKTSYLHRLRQRLDTGCNNLNTKLSNINCLWFVFSMRQTSIRIN